MVSSFVAFSQGDKTLRPATKDVDTKCEKLTFNNPYLQLGPFNLENLNKEGNYVAVVHHLLGSAEMESVKAGARGQMKPTPYTIGKQHQKFSYERRSKVKYIK